MIYKLIGFVNQLTFLLFKYAFAWRLQIQRYLETRRVSGEHLLFIVLSSQAFLSDGKRLTSFLIRFSLVLFISLPCTRQPTM